MCSAPNNTQCFRWTFTAYFPIMDEDAVAQSLTDIGVKKYCFQEEKCPTTGRLHFQGRFSLKVKKRFSELIKCFEQQEIGSGIHLEIERDEVASDLYCMKSDTRTRGPWSWPKQTYLGQDLITNLVDWQRRLFKHLQGPVDDREIIWVHDAAGCTGKSSFAKYCAVKLGAEVFSWVSSKHAMHQVAKEADDCKVFIFDLTRTKPEAMAKDDVYSCLEQIKNGYVRSMMYEGGKKLFLPPHVLVLANCKPTFSAVSADRWNVITLNDSHRVEYMLHNRPKRFSLTDE